MDAARRTATAYRRVPPPHGLTVLRRWNNGRISSGSLHTPLHCTFLCHTCTCTTCACLHLLHHLLHHCTHCLSLLHLHCTPPLTAVPLRWPLRTQYLLYFRSHLHSGRFILGSLNISSAYWDSLHLCTCCFHTSCSVAGLSGTFSAGLSARHLPLSLYLPPLLLFSCLDGLGWDSCVLEHCFWGPTTGYHTAAHKEPIGTSPPAVSGAGLQELWGLSADLHICFTAVLLPLHFSLGLL